MIVSRLVGGLGNQMFQYAAGRALALRRGVEFRIDRRAFLDYKTHAFGMACFQVELNEAPPHLLPNPPAEGRVQRWFRKFLPTPLKVFAENSFPFDAHVLALLDNTYLDGYWQTEKYFCDFADVIRADFTVRHAPSEANHRWLDEIARTHSVSLHIRRGDYVSSPSAATVHGVCDLSYYERALAHIHIATGIDPVLYVFSDDLDWVAANLKLPFQMNLVRDNDSSTNYEDLRLMTACRHHIIANSSFSWWGAWMDGRRDSITVAPVRWFAGDTPDARDLVPQRWVRQ
ncbi:alpha-1,2-fucosyltransferase [Hydrogenophaga sp.]|uniref:alpha-1,2-fucosyltransferase n=1 Tax=Hydrogenophaga sp. TaxID=1904254 RepID=UPI0027315AEA|nr:alpha-1,2-fucosyltransferase [Hydrogenophaga sp.]MDP1683935.1 alpha-1,2-fucosyltransferase [Hydrogenophaga sp.]